MLSTLEIYLLIAVFGSVLFLSVFYVHRKKGTGGETFLVANRNVSTFQGALSIAASWIWAPAVFICSQKAYEQGIAGVFWFTAPNILCFFIFAPFAVKLRKAIPHGFSFPDYIYEKHKDKSLHLASLIVYMGYQMGAIIINSVAGGALLSILTAIPYHIAVCLIFAVASSYSLLSGLKASVITDAIQMIMILAIGFILIPWITHQSGGWSMITNHLGGVSGNFGDMFNPTVAYGFGIAATIGLMSGPFADQVFYQRAFAVQKHAVAKTFIYGGLIFGIVPILLSMLGFIGAGTPEVVAMINQNPAVNTQMVGPLAIAHYLPKFALMGFVVLAFAGLCSSLDSALNGISSLVTVDIYKRYLHPKADTKTLLRIGRSSMLLVGVVGLTVALLRPKLIWLFFINGALASTAFFPAYLSIYWKKLPAKGALWAIILSLALGTPLSIYANIKEDTDLIVLAAVTSIAIGLLTCVFFDLFCPKRLRSTKAKS